MIGNHLEPFKFWCQKVLPNVYDDSLSYYEYLCKMNDYLNDVIEQINTLTDNMEDYETDLTTQWTTYRDELSAQWQTYKTYIDTYFDNLDVQQEINNKLDSMASDGSLDALIRPYVNSQISSDITAWLNEHVDPVGSAVIVDNTLTVSGAAADAKVVGDKFDDLDENLNDEIPITFEIGAINDGVPVTSPVYARIDKFFIARKNSVLSITNNTSFVLSNMMLYYYSGENVSDYVSSSSISDVALNGTKNVVLTRDGYFRLRVSKPHAESNITESDITALENSFTIKQLYAIDLLKNYTDDRVNGLESNVNDDIDLIYEQLYDDVKCEFEIGAIVNGNPQNSTKYCRSKNFDISRKDLKIKITNNTDFILSNLNVYYYSSQDYNSYISDESMSNVGIGASVEKTLSVNGYFKLRVSQPSATTDMDATDLTNLKNSISFEEVYAVPYLEKYANDLYNENKNSINSLLNLCYTGQIDEANKLVPFYCQKGDSVTIRTSNGDRFIGNAGTNLYFYDINKTFFGTYGIGSEHGNSRTIKYNYDTTAYYVRIGVEERLTITNNTKINYANVFMSPLDFATISTDIQGKFSIALQTDTHVSLFTNYKSNGTVYNKSDFSVIEKIFNAINRVNPNLFINLGDIVRGYEFDPDYETRKSIDKYIELANNYISTNKIFIVGNHDDDTMWYHSTYNDKQNVSDLLYPNEQFNRIIKYGLNSNKNTNYCYNDINGIRFIALDQKDYDYSTTIPNINDFKIGATQLDWLQNTALDTNLPVVILTHAPLTTTLFEGGGTGFGDALQIIEDFVNNGGTVVAVLSGHTHTQGYATENNVNHIVFANGYNWFELITIDLTNSEIVCKSILKTQDTITLSF